MLTARVTDTNSQIATSAPVNVNVANAVGTAPTVTISVNPVPAQGLQTLSAVNFIANAFANGAGSTLTSVEFFLNDVSIGVAAREQTTNLYRLAYDFSRFDFTVVTPDANGRFPPGALRHRARQQQQPDRLRDRQPRPQSGDQFRPVDPADQLVADDRHPGDAGCHPPELQ